MKLELTKECPTCDGAGHWYVERGLIPFNELNVRARKALSKCEIEAIHLKQRLPSPKQGESEFVRFDCPVCKNRGYVLDADGKEILEFIKKFTNIKVEDYE